MAYSVVLIILPLRIRPVIVVTSLTLPVQSPNLVALNDGAQVSNYLAVLDALEKIHILVSVGAK